MPRDHLEIERTFDVPDATSMPSLVGGPVARVAAPVRRTLQATYVDTDRLSLARAGATLRRRTGGDDDGWHLKLPVGVDRRLEVHQPLRRGARSDAAPLALRRRVAAHVRGRDVRPVVRLTTRRDELALLDADDVVLAVVCDDHVQAERLDGSGRVTAWREWEVELVDGGPGVLDIVGTLFSTAGVRVSRHPSKLARALGDDLPTPADDVAPGRRASAADVLRHRLRRQVAGLVEADPRVRADETEAVHDMRVATRMLRSLLATWRPLLDQERTEPVRTELKWLAGVLGAARDAEVLRARVAALVAEQPPELVLGPVAVRADDELSTRYRDAHRAAVTVLGGRRYLALLDALDALVDDLPVLPAAQARATRVLPGLLQRDWKRLRRAVEAPTTSDADALHEARKAAKRLKYATAGAVGLYGPPAKRLRRTAKRVQTVLGQRQDAVGAQAELRRLGVQAHLAGENGFTFGRLHAVEEARQAAAEREFRTLWDAVEAPRVRRWSAR